MSPLLERYSEPYSPTGSLAAEGVVNQLGRPDIEPLEVLVREAVQNCWDAKRPTARGVRVEISRLQLDGDTYRQCRRELLVDPPPGLPLADVIEPGMELLCFSDFETDGLGGPTRADRPGQPRDFADFVRNIGQPPDKELGGGSFGYGKAAFYIASAARTVFIDTACMNEAGDFERRFIGCALGDNFEIEGEPHTGRHWWGRIDDMGVPEPLLDSEAEQAASLLGLPLRNGEDDLGTTIAIVAPNLASSDEQDSSMKFVAECLAWNFWPRMVDTRGASQRTMEFRVTDNGVRIQVPNPRNHPRLRSFVEALDRLREEPDEDDELVIDRGIESFRPAQHIGRLVLARDAVAPVALPAGLTTQGARLTAAGLHHVALMRNAELVVKYLPGAPPATGRFGYAGIFKCAVDVDEAFRKAEPPTHDDWVFRALPKGRERSFVKIGLERIADVCREAAGFGTELADGTSQGVPLGEFADALGSLMAGATGTGARISGATRAASKPRRPGRTATQSNAGTNWVEGTNPGDGGVGGAAGGDTGPTSGAAEKPKLPPPQVRAAGEGTPAMSQEGIPVMRFPFQLRSNGNTVRLTASIEIMANDGGQVEGEAPAGAPEVSVRAWTGPSGSQVGVSTIVVAPEESDGDWNVDVDLADDAMMRLDLQLGIE